MKTRRCIGMVSAVALVVAAPHTLAFAQACTQLNGVFATVQTGITSGQSIESGSCGGGDAPEATFSFHAPRAGTYTIDTIGSQFAKRVAPYRPANATGSNIFNALYSQGKHECITAFLL